MLKTLEGHQKMYAEEKVGVLGKRKNEDVKGEREMREKGSSN